MIDMKYSEHILDLLVLILVITGTGLVVYGAICNEHSITKIGFELQTVGVILLCAGEARHAVQGQRSPAAEPARKSC